MKTKELMIIAALRKNSRESLTKLSKNVHVPISTLHDRMKIYKNGVIKKHTSIVDFSKLGYNTRAKMLLKVDVDKRKSIQEHLENIKNVNSLFKITNGYDYMADVVFKNIKQMEDFIEKLEKKFKIERKAVFYIVDDIKVEDFISNPASVQMIM